MNQDDITVALESLQIDYAIVGGIANAIWGEPRATIDVDVTVSVNEEDPETFRLQVGRCVS